MADDGGGTGTREGIALLVFGLTTTAPAFFRQGYFPFWMEIPFPAYLGVALLGGAIGGACLCPRPISAGLFGGALAGPLGLIALDWWVKDRETVFALEIVFVQLVGMLPGLALGGILYSFGAPPAPRPQFRRSKHGRIRRKKEPPPAPE